MRRLKYPLARPKASRPVVPPPKKREPEQRPRPKPKEVPKTKREVNTYEDDFEVEESLDFGVPARSGFKTIYHDRTSLARDIVFFPASCSSY